MPDAPAPQQTCPACGTLVDVAEAEPLSRIVCPKCGDKFRVERTFDNFMLVETLGVGGMGAVYKARDTRLERMVALKLLRKELSADPTEAARLEHEARVTAKVNHPNVVQVYSAGSAHGQIYLVMELVDHGSLDDLMAQHTRVPEAQVLQAGIQVARGLRAAHEKGLIHRDVKPANILFSDPQTAKIGDFGLAGAAEQKGESRGEIWGTPYYVAPERLNNEPEDFRSDIYSLGATLFHALAGKPPMEGDTTSASELRQLKTHPPDLLKLAPELSKETARVINRMLAPDPANRFTSYAHLIDQLLGAYRAVAGGPAPGGGKGKTVGLILAGVAVLALLGGGYFFFKKRQAAAAAPLAQPAASTAPAGEDTAALQRRFDDARRLVIDGKFDQAATAFGKLAAESGNRQPLGNWIRMHLGLASLLQGKSGPARDAFQLVERAGPFSNAKNDADLARFFVETNRILGAPGPARASDAANLNPKTADAFAFFLFGVKDWQISEFGESGPLMEKFAATELPKELAWINDYKPMAKKFADDFHIYTEWKQLPPRPSTPAESQELIAKVKALDAKLQRPGPLKDALQSDIKRLTSQLAQRQKAETEAAAQLRTKALEAESPTWNAAVSEAHTKIAALDFAGALAVIDAAQVTEPSLVQARDAERKKANWLVDWRKRLIADLNTGRYRARISDVPNVEYEGVASANEREIILRIPGGKGSAPAKWTGLSPKTLLALSSAFFTVTPPETADRQWLSAVFAQATGQSEAAKTLGEAAAAAKPEYKDQLPLLAPSH